MYHKPLPVSIKKHLWNRDREKYGAYDPLRRSSPFLPPYDPVQRSSPFQPRAESAPNLRSSSPEKTVTFLGYAYWTMDGYLSTRGEMDRSMNHSAQSKFPCSRAATYDEYAFGKIAGLPNRNETGLEVTFVGPRSEGRGEGSLDHRNTLLCRKKAVLPKDFLDGTCSVASIRGNKACICVYNIDRVKRQPSITQFGYARNCVDERGRVLPDSSLTQLPPCPITWTAKHFASKAI